MHLFSITFVCRYLSTLNVEDMNQNITIMVLQWCLTTDHYLHVMFSL
jgi:hypothetical protein